MSTVDTTTARGDLFELLSDVAIIANLARDPESALVLATERICHHTGWDAGHAFTVEGDELDSTGVWHLESDLDMCTFGDDTLITDFSHGQGLPGRVAISGRAALVPDLSVDHGFIRRRPALDSGLRSAFAFPVLAGTEVVAVMEFFSTRPTSPDEALLDVMDQIGVQLGRVFERAAAQELAERNEREIREVLDGAGDAYIAIDSTGLVTEWNRTAEKVFGWSRAEVLGSPVADLIIPPEYREAHNRGIERVIMTGETRVLGEHLELSAVHREGHEFPIDITMWSQRTVDGWRFFSFIRDISARKREEREREYRAQHDDLTGLPNRTSFVERLRDVLTRPRARTAVAVFAIEIDQLRQMTDGLGPRAGDQLLVTVARRVLGIVRPADVVARTTNEVLMVMCEYTIDDGFEPSAMARRIAETLDQPVRLESDTTFVSVCVGVSTTAEAGSGPVDPETLIASATAALNEAKGGGNGSFAVFDETMVAAATRRNRLENDLRRAVRHHELRLHYQPLVDASTGAVTGVEALLRWLHPEEGMVSPAEFIPLAERTGLIIPIGRWVIEEATRQALVWQAEIRETGRPSDTVGDRTGGESGLKVAVNLSARQLAQSDLVDTVTTTLDRAALDPRHCRITFEVTESLLMDDPDRTGRVLGQLRDLGADLSIDDFGTGYSSLAYLKRFPVQTVKIDRSFVTNIATDPADRAIATAVVDIAHALGMTVTAEGIETGEQVAFLRDIGVDTFQGFFFARPDTPEAIHDVLFGPPLDLGAITAHTDGSAS